MLFQEWVTKRGGGSFRFPGLVADFEGI